MSAEKRLHNKSRWTNANEKKFIREIGSFNEVGASMSRASLLKNYIIGIEKRVNWGGMDPEEIMAYARKQLEMEM